MLKMVSRLEDLSRNKLAIELANELDFKKEIRRFGHIFKFRNEGLSWFEHTEQKVSDTLQKFPSWLRKKIPTHLIIFCIMRSLRWAEFQMKIFDFSFDYYYYYFLRSSHFTSKGMIKVEILAREMVNDTKIKLSCRFCIACYFCFSDVIPTLWEQLPEDKKPQLDNEVYTHHFGVYGDHEIVHWWSRYLLGEFQSRPSYKEESFSLVKFMVSLKNGNYVAFKNCFEELNEFERKKAVIFSRESLNNICYGCDSSDIIRFQIFLFGEPYIEMVVYFLHCLDEEELNVLFQPHMVLCPLYFLLIWPYQHLFMDVVQRFWGLLSESMFYFLLHRIMSLMRNSFTCKFCDYSQIFRDFWRQSPSSFKRAFFQFEIAERDYHHFLLTIEEKRNFNIFRREYIGLRQGRCMIEEIFNSPSLSIEDEEITRLILGCATVEEKFAIVELQQKKICSIPKVCDLKKIDLFIECCVPEERIASFKKERVNDEGTQRYLWNIIVGDKLNELQKILTWAFDAEEIKEWQQRLFSLYAIPREIYVFSSNELKCIDKFLEWTLSSDEVKEFKKRFAPSGKFIARHYKSLLLEGNFEEIDSYLNWVFSSEIDIKNVKKDLALETINHMHNRYVTKGLRHVKKFIKWSDLSWAECKDFKRRFAFYGQVIDFYKNIVTERKLHRADTFIQWAELTESEVKEFKNLLVFDKEIIISACFNLMVKGKAGFVKKLLNWSQISEEEIDEFYSILVKRLRYYIRSMVMDSNFVGIKRFFMQFPWSEEKVNMYIKKMCVKYKEVVEFYVRKNKLDELEEILSWCFSSKKKFVEFKKNLKKKDMCRCLILDKRFEDVDKFFTWSGIHDRLKKRLLENIIGHEDILKMVLFMFQEKKKNEIRRLLSWLSSNDILSKKWNEKFLDYCNDYIDYRSCLCCYEDYCPACYVSETLGLSSEVVLEFSQTIDEYINKLKVRRKRKLESSLNSKTKESKRSRHY